jgi:hypothetical protein
MPLWCKVVQGFIPGQSPVERAQTVSSDSRFSPAAIFQCDTNFEDHDMSGEKYT